MLATIESSIQTVARGTFLRLLYCVWLKEANYFGTLQCHPNCIHLTIKMYKGYCLVWAWGMGRATTLHNNSFHLHFLLILRQCAHMLTPCPNTHPWQKEAVSLPHERPVQTHSRGKKKQSLYHINALSRHTAVAERTGVSTTWTPCSNTQPW